MINLIDVLTHIIEKLDTIPTNNKHWDETVKSKIYHDIKEATVDLLRLKRIMKYANCSESIFIKLVKSGENKLVRINTSKPTEDTPLYVDATKEEFFKLWTEAETTRFEFMEGRLNLHIYSLAEDEPVTFSIILDERKSG